MTFSEAVNYSKGRMIKLVDLELRIINDKVYDRQGNQHCFTKISDILSTEWEII